MVKIELENSSSSTQIVYPMRHQYTARALNLRYSRSTSQMVKSRSTVKTAKFPLRKPPRQNQFYRKNYQEFTTAVWTKLTISRTPILIMNLGPGYQYAPHLIILLSTRNENFRKPTRKRPRGNRIIQFGIHKRQTQPKSTTVPFVQKENI